MSLSFAKRLIVGACPNTHKTHQDGLLIFILSIQSYQHKLYLLSKFVFSSSSQTVTALFYINKGITVLLPPFPKADVVKIRLFTHILSWPKLCVTQIRQIIKHNVIVRKTVFFECFLCVFYIVYWCIILSTYLSLKTVYLLSQSHQF